MSGGLDPLFVFYRWICLKGRKYRSGMVNSNTVNSNTVNSNTINLKFHLIQSFCEIFVRFLPFHF